MSRFSLVLAIGPLLLLSGACVSSPTSQAPRAPDVVPVRTPDVYTGDETPAAPRESSRPLRENIYAVQQSGAPEILLSGPLSAASAVSSSRGGTMPALSSLFNRPRAPQAAAPSPIATQPAKPRELYDVEAHIEMEVLNIAQGRTRVTELTRTFGGDLVNEVVEDRADTRGASLSLRVPSAKVQAFLESLIGIGRVRSQKVETKDVGRTVSDAEILLSNLQHALRRYEELLAKAANVAEAAQIERELERVRTSINRVQGDLDWLRDRVARSTIYVTLTTPAAELLGDPEAKLHPGLRATLMVDVPPASDARTFGGGGLSLTWSRHFGVDLDVMTSLERTEGSAIDCFLVTLGGEIYSDFLGGGRRRWINPYFGFRGGYARIQGQGQVPLGGTLGIEIFKTHFVVLDLHGRVYALLGPDDGVHLGLQPALGVNVAY